MAQVLFLAQGMSQNDVVFDVLSGIADAGDSLRPPGPAAQAPTRPGSAGLCQRDDGGRSAPPRPAPLLRRLHAP